jgi:hypothetical protein
MEMERAVWMVLAVGALVGMFAVCVAGVTAFVRTLENALAAGRRRRKQAV